MTEEEFILCTIDKDKEFKKVEHVFGYHTKDRELMLVAAILKKK